MQKAKNAKANDDSAVEQMFAAGAHYGYSKTRRHPSVSPYIYATKNKSDIINLEKTSTQLDAAKKYVDELGAKGKVLLFVGTKPEAKQAVKSAAESLGMPYVTERWIGGTLSNFTEIKKRIAELENYQKESTTGALEKYTKKERVVMAKKMEKLARYYTGLLGLKKIPDALFVVDARAEHIAATEANKSGVPVIALVNSDTNIKKIEHPIVANDAGIPSIKFFAQALAEAYKKGGLSTTAKTS
ncbi:MAG: 30S ribosomal protein S2 [Candidatus Paceibacterota bacterium]|jgi:small subunit ribosomal protein S2